MSPGIVATLVYNYKKMHLFATLLNLNAGKIFKMDVLTQFVEEWVLFVPRH